MEGGRLTGLYGAGNYFRSKWCCSELATMLHRQRLWGRDVVIPVRYTDGEHPLPVQSGPRPRESR